MSKKIILSNPVPILTISENYRINVVLTLSDLIKRVILVILTSLYIFPILENLAILFIIILSS